ncbi:MAG TPA: hypothetical protein VKG79_10475 [Bryobacteraceae bacterium]|nr:hypothetical protein [Bryobacteraceae bacterium]
MAGKRSARSTLRAPDGGAHLLFEVRPTDLATSASVAAVLVSVGVLAGYFPARRATAIDPAHALRSE